MILVARIRILAGLLPKSGPAAFGEASNGSGSWFTGLWILMVVLLSSTGCSDKNSNSRKTADSPPKPETKAWFSEASTNSGLIFRHSSGYSGRRLMPEMMTGGAGVLDFDKDGLMDVYLVDGGSADPSRPVKSGNRLFRNLGGFKFEDVTARAGLDSGNDYGMGCACADFDGDGWVDLYVTNLKGNRLFRNRGNGTFEDVTRRAGVADGAWGTSAAFFDYDLDGDLDLVIANYLRWSIEAEIQCYSRGGRPDYCSPLNYKAPAVDSLYRNEGNGTFTNVTASAGFQRAYGNGLGVVCADFDQDGWPDVLVANDAMPNQLWINQKNGTFLDEAVIRGCAVNSMGMSEANMGIAAVDLLQRGARDIFITHLEAEGNRLWINTNGYFMDTVRPKGPGSTSHPYTGFGVVFADFDNDGELDLYVANGKVKFGQVEYDSADPYAEPNTLMRGLGGGDFEEVRPLGGTQPVLVATSRSVAVADFDNDGGLDLVVVNRDGPAHLLRNQTGQNRSWILLEVLDRKGSHAIGATVKLVSGARTYWRSVQPNEGYCSSHDPRVHCGLGDSKQVESVEVHWPGGKIELFGPLNAGALHVIRQGKGRDR